MDDMCGRFVSSHSPDKIAAYFGASFEGDALPANFNVAPTHDVYGVVESADGPKLTTFHWGLVPLWAKDIKIGNKMINARAETITEKPAFKGLFKKHRLLIPMDGFYEWKVVEGQDGAKPTKHPQFIHRVDSEPLAVGGLWALWRDRSKPADPSSDQEMAAEQSASLDADPWLHSCTIMTTAANETMAPVHNRMPVLVPQSAWAQWLDPSNQDLESLTALLQPAPNDVLTMYPVSTAVNNVRNKGEELLQQIDG